MPIKRRVAKAREIDDWKLGELIEGPGTCLLAGCGYYVPRNGHGALADERDGFWWDLTPEAQQVVLQRMAADWHRVGEAILAKAVGAPWALKMFGHPGQTMGEDHVG